MRFKKKIREIDAEQYRTHDINSLFKICSLVGAKNFQHELYLESFPSYSARITLSDKEETKVDLKDRDWVILDDNDKTQVLNEEEFHRFWEKA